MDDLQTSRFADKELGYGSFRCEMGRLLIDEACEMYEEAEDGQVAGAEEFG